ncbi:helix-turn-helix transcriptional regulator [Treponema sp.]|uniref:helix-turn-helix transcriptional regulator n=1 Tax=Treponema sp. TaxID=166 RepID=UPI00298D8AFE|nr:WYL domain-containing protein [Treponema sp.]
MLQIDEEIRSGKFPNATSLSKKIEVSSRTIQRDIEYMRDMYNAPIEFDAYKNGYYYTEENFYIKSVPLSEGELFSVALFDQLLEQYRNTPLENDLRSVFKKIEMSLPNKITLDSSFLQNQITFIPDQMGTINPENFSKVFSALKNRHVLDFEYRPLQKTTWMTRRINPLHAVCQKGNWYVMGFCHDKKDIRVFNFSRMQNVTESKEEFDIPEDFNPDKYFDKEIGIWLSATKKYTVELLISAEIGTFALERSWNKNQKIEQREDGSVWVSFETTQLPEVKRWVLGQGKTVKVLGPDELIAQVKEEVAVVLGMY